MDADDLVGAVERGGPVDRRFVGAELDGASSSTVSKRLAEFQEARLVSRTQYDEIPRRVEYALTEEGWELAERLGPLLEWASDRQEA
jgi:DNA-binding HxlR family transcriptional regulator